MRVSSKVLCQAGLFTAFACAGIAQTNQSAGVPQAAIRSGQMTWFSAAPGGGNPFRPVTGAPYSAEQVSEHVQTLADGTHIKQTNMQSKIYRDSQGRTRTEQSIFPSSQAVGAAFPNFIEIADPVAGYRYTLDPRNRTARRQAWPPAFMRTNKTGNAFYGAVTGKTASVIAPPQQGTAIVPTVINPADGNRTAATGSSERPHPEIVQESLGTQNIEGVNATGRRTTVTYPEGFFGNDRPMTTTSETWTSPELKTTVLSTSSDPRFGDNTTRLTDIVQAEPDSSLFQIPDDYTVIDQPEGIGFDARPAK